MESDGHKPLLDITSLGFQPLRNAEFFAQRFDRLIESESGRVRGEFEKHATGLAKINGVKIGAIQNWCHIQMLRDFPAPLFLRRIVGGAKRDVMY